MIPSPRSILVSGILLLGLVLASQAAAYTCKGSNSWTKLPSATKQKLLAIASKQPYAQGRFFRIEKNGKVSYILGTIHVPPIKQLTLPDHVMQKVKTSRRVYLEKTRKEFKAFEAMVKRKPNYLRRAYSETLIH